MAFISRRPALPTGTTVAGFPDIRRALHVDERLELYLLDRHDDSDIVLLLSQWDTDTVPGEDRLRGLWRLSGIGCLSAGGRLLLAGSFLAGHQAVLQVEGTWLGESTHPGGLVVGPASLVRALTDLALHAHSTGIAPDLTPSLLWYRRDGSTPRVASVAATWGSKATESSLLGSIARVIYWVAAGIDLASRGEMTEPPPLRLWCPEVAPPLSALLSRCAAPEGAPDRLRSLAELRDAVDAIESPQDSGEAARRPVTRRSPRLAEGAARELRGLAKVAGMHALKSLLDREVVRPLRDPEPFRRYGLSIPNGVLLFGPPGCGKTYIARQLAEELGYYFVEIIPSETASPYIHQSVLRIRDLFETAAERSPSVVFIDEFEALVPSRSDLGGHQQYKSEEVNEFLAHLGTCAEKGVFVIAATNEPEKIDAAVRRTGRLDKIIYVGPPDAEARAEMLTMHLAGRPVAPDFDASAIAAALEGYSASDIRFLVDEAARQAMLEDQPITVAGLREASSRVPASVPPDVEERYRSFEQRGI